MKDDQRPPAPTGDAAPDRLTRALRDLPPAAASPSFTDAVLARVGPPAARPRPAPRRAALPALLAGAAALGALVLLLRAPGGPPTAGLPDAAPRRTTSLELLRGELEQLRQLRQEQRDLAAEVESLRAQPRNPGVPVIYLGQSGGVDLVLDLGHLPQASPGAGEREGEHR